MKLNRISAALLLAGLHLPAQALDLSGRVTDEAGNPVAKATVSLLGSQKEAKTDQDGRFHFTVKDNSHLHLHVTAPRYQHGELEIDGGTEPLELSIRLKESSIENIVVTAGALRRGVLESANPITVLAEDDLRLAAQPSLGETLAREPGVQSSYFGPAASRPVIRGMDGPRVRVVQNGLGTGDASTVSADHAVTTESGTARQIEVLRGPATLLYGNGAVGGVVNVVDNRVPRREQEGLSGELEGRYATVNDERTLTATLDGGSGAFAWHLDGNRRRAHDTAIPGAADIHEPDQRGLLENSSLENDEFTLGASHVGEHGFIGLSYNSLDSNYGVPGHHHGEEHEEEGHEEEGHEEEAEESVRIDLDKTAWQLLAELDDPFAGFSRLQWAAGYNDYEHTELEGGAVGTVFKNETREARLALEHNPLAEWQGVLGLHWLSRDFGAQGEEAFSPDSQSRALAAFLVEERQLGEVTLELGGRLEHYRIEASPFELETDEGHEQVAPGKISHNNLSLSASANWRFTDGYSLGAALSRAERGATAEELYSFGPHLATGTFEVGSLFHLEAEGEHGHGHFEGGEPQTEVANNLDITFRKFGGDLGLTANLFYNRIDHYFYQENTGLVAEGGHEEEEGEAEHDHGGELPIFQYRQADVEFYGYELDASWQLDEHWSVDAFSDYTRARLKDGGELPRIPALRLGLTLNYDWDDWHMELGATRYGRQDKVAEGEEETPGYTLVDAALTYRHYTDAGDLLFFLKGSNLTDREARPHTSFLKEVAPLPGRNLTLGVRYAF
ncbi:TonB-dependent receptor [Gallaecimonas sp. GXIMD4217]|uniref:TonB-dependent receptor n=1 Tax=Gallaecimonas sp. GXIMD4217 TaxID=3131927 RepID=UPI00311B254C